jgi:hypothetical protein
MRFLSRFGLALLAPAAILTGCSGGGADSAPASDECDCEDGYDYDNDLPDAVGYWTADFAQKLFDENCGLSNLDQNSEGWLQGAAMEIEGLVPDNIVANIAGEQYEGAMTDDGSGIVLSGIHTSEEHGEMHVSIGGLLYQESYLYNTLVIEGFAYLGLDTIGDGNIDCGARGDFVARLSGRR